MASSIRKNGKWIISASGGIQLDAWAILRKIQREERLRRLREEARLAEHDDWWWN
jgi:hypothetical protein